ncbi:MAG: helix-turn-helix domain-containing protein [Pirellulales bacterium]|nr:helix-turn-helix domain-containing protein [Pirellulales bacterium]
MVLRRVAVELLQDGSTQDAVAERLHVSRSSVKRWIKAFRGGGVAALKPKTPKPAARRLSED